MIELILMLGFTFIGVCIFLITIWTCEALYDLGMSRYRSRLVKRRAARLYLKLAYPHKPLINDKDEWIGVIMKRDVNNTHLPNNTNAPVHNDIKGSN